MGRLRLSPGHAPFGVTELKWQVARRRNDNLSGSAGDPSVLGCLLENAQSHWFLAISILVGRARHGRCLALRLVKWPTIEWSPGQVPL